MVALGGGGGDHEGWRLEKMGSGFIIIIITIMEVVIPSNPER